MAKEVRPSEVDTAWKEYAEAVDFYQYQYTSNEISYRKMHQLTKAHGDKCAKLEQKYLAQ